MHWRDAHRAAMVAAADAQEELELDTFQRIDVFGAMSEAGLKVIFREVGEGLRGPLSADIAWGAPRRDHQLLASPCSAAL